MTIEQEAYEPIDAMEHILAAMLEEAFELMDQAASSGAHINEGSSPDSAALLQVSTRLARVTGWLLSYSGSDEAKSASAEALMRDASEDAAHLARSARIEPIASRVNALAARAVRLHVALRPQEDAGQAAQSAG